MAARAELTDRRFGKLVAVSPAESIRGQWFWNVRCDCGNPTPKTVRAHDLLTGKQTSCGCIHVTHGATRGGKCSPEYLSWRSMIARCDNPKATGFANYGGRGITICARWRDFAAFLADMGPRLTPEHSLDRKQIDGNYEPGNCKWSTMAEQNRNKRSLRMLTVGGETTYLAEWARRTGIGEDTIKARIDRYGWDHERAVLTPARSVIA